MKKIQFVYYTDALCGWCYGFKPIMEKIHNEFKGQIEFDVVSGGLFLGERVGLVNDAAPHIKAGAYKRVEEATGVKFGKVFLDDVFGEGKLILNSFYPAVALCVVKDKQPQDAVKFIELLLSAYYYDGLDSQDVDGHGKYFAKLGLDAEEMIKLTKESKYQELAIADFKRFSNAGVNVFPSFALKKDGKETILSNGSMTYEAIRKELLSAIEAA